MRIKGRGFFWVISIVLLAGAIIVGCIAEDFVLPVRISGKVDRIDTDTFFAFSEYRLTINLRGRATSVEIYEGDQLLDTVPAMPVIHLWPLVTDIGSRFITLVARNPQGKSLQEITVSLEPDTSWLPASSAQEAREAESAGLYYKAGDIWLFYSFPYMGSKSGAYRRAIRDAIQGIPTQEVWALVTIAGSPWVCSLEDFRDNPANVIPLENIEPPEAFPERVVDFSQKRWLDPAQSQWLDPAEMAQATAESDAEGIAITLTYTHLLMPSLSLLDQTQFRLTQAGESVFPNTIHPGATGTQLILQYDPLPLGASGIQTLFYTQSEDGEKRLKDYSNLVDVKANDEQPVVVTQKLTLTLISNPTESGVLSGEGEYHEGEMVVITATPHEGYFFVTWTINGEVVSTDSEHTYTMPAQNTTLVANFFAPVMVRVNSGTFQMGDEVGDLSDWAYATPVHQVTLTYDYWIGKYEVTFDEYDAFCDDTDKSEPDDEGWGRGNRPVINVNWWDAIAFCNWRSEQEGLPVAYRLQGEEDEGSLLNAAGNVTEDITQVVGYRLLTEAEFEYAASGGHNANDPRFLYAGSDTIDEVAWYSDNSDTYGAGQKTQPVGGKDANELGLHDMNGNVWEWCHDWWGVYTPTAKIDPIGPSTSSDRAARGGSWHNSAARCRVADRGSGTPDDRDSGLGLRLARTEGVTKAVITTESSPTTGGEVQINQGDWDSQQSLLVEIGSTVSIDAKPNEGYHFVNWSKDDTEISTHTNHTYTMSAENVTLVANFEEVGGPADPGEMVRVNRGTFQMGEWGEDIPSSRPVHQVTFTYDYWIGKYEVTFDQYDAFSDDTASYKPSDENWGRGDRPVIRVNWWDAIAYCNWLSERNGLARAYDSNGNLLNRNGEITTDITQVEGYRLPTEAEWEYAASGGHQALPIPPRFLYAGSDTIDEVAWYTGNSDADGTGRKTQPVGGKDANELGLHDMSGNAREWCHDWSGTYTSSAKTNPIGPSSGTHRVRRGGSWYVEAQQSRVVYRSSVTPNTRNAYLGFRIARTEGVTKAVITTASSPTTGGEVQINQGDWDSQQSLLVEIGSPVSIDAKPNEGYLFVNWTKDDTEISTQTSHTYTMPAENVTLLANFEEFGEPVTIRSKAFPNFGGLVGMDDQDLSETLEEDIPAGQSVTLKAQPFEGWVFLGWWEAGVDPEDENQPLDLQETWIYQPDRDIDLIALFDPNIDGETEWDFQATLTLQLDPSPIVLGTSGSGTVTITQDPVRMVGSATIPAPDPSSVSEASVRGILAFGLRRTLVKAFPALAPPQTQKRVEIPSENIIRIRGPENGEFIMDYDVTFHDFDPEDPYDSAVTLAWAQFGVGDEHYYIVVEIDPKSLDPQEVEFRVNLLYVTDEEQETQEDITGHLDAIITPRPQEP